MRTVRCSTDATGDNEGAGTNAYADDIISTRVESGDDGRVTFTVTLRTADAQGGHLYHGRYAVGIYIDADQDQSTGDQGDEAAFVAFGRDGQEPQASSAA